MNRLDTPKSAAECVCGSPEDNFAVIAGLWETAMQFIREHAGELT